MSLQNVVDNYLNKSKKTLDFFVADKNKKEIIASGVALSKTLKKGGKILICGNGGSAAHAQHFAAELIGRFKIDTLFKDKEKDIIKV